MTEITTHSEEETRAFGRGIGSSLYPGAVVAFSGDLGSGKTALIRGICERFGCGDQVSSPTFTIINVYDGTARIAHCDLYRVTRTEEFAEIGLEEYFRPDTIALIEWGERALPLLPVPRTEIAAQHGEDADSRRFRMQEVRSGETTILFDPLIPAAHDPRH